MTNARLATLFVLTIIAVAQPARAQIFKCVSKQGAVIYSQNPCYGESSKPLGVTDNSANTGHLRRGAARTREEASRSTASEQSQASASSSNEMSGYERDRRVRELEVDLASPSASKQQKAAANAELDRIRRGVSQRRTAGEDREMRSLNVDVNSIDKKAREQAVQRMESLNDRYERPEHIAAREAKRAADAAEAKRRLAEVTITHGSQLVPGSNGTALDARTGQTWKRDGPWYVNSLTGQRVLR